MSLKCALSNCFELRTGPKHCGYLQFADGSYDKTVGQVDTYWTFASGERIPVVFEILEHCCSDVIIGDDILTEHEVFQKHAASILSYTGFDDNCFELVPFDFVRPWQKGCEQLMEKTKSARATGDRSERNEVPNDSAHVEEQRRRDIWNYEHDFGAKTSPVAKELELARGERYETRRVCRSPQPLSHQSQALGGPNSRHRDASSPTSQS